MKSSLVAAFTVGVGVPAGVAIAADIPPPVVAPVAVATPVYNGAGLYPDTDVDFDFPMTPFTASVSAEVNDAF